MRLSLLSVLIPSYSLVSSLSTTPYQKNHFRRTTVTHEDAPLTTTTRMASSTTNDNVSENLLSQITFRTPASEDIPTCLDIELASYPSDEAASMESLTYRQQNAPNYFLCACASNNDDDQIIGFICSTRCNTFEDEDAMSTHDPNGQLLAIHSVVVDEQYRRQGIATKMLQFYIQMVQEQEKEKIPPTSSSADSPIESIVLLAKSHLLGFYVQGGGFRVNRPSPIVHGKELWYELELPLATPTKQPKIMQPLPGGQQSWFCKTEQFSKPFPVVKPHLEAHKKWVEELRRQGYSITSGYRVDSEGKPGGGGLMFLAAANYEEALSIVQQDPLIVNDCVDWQLNGWIGQVGDVALL